MMQIGLLGFGVVGRGLYDLTQGREDIRVRKVLCLEDITLPDATVTHDFNDILNDPEIDTVVEAMGGLHPAYDFVRAAMEAGKNIVTSNKALVNGFYDELIPLAKEKGLLFRCTAAVGGGICWLSELERARRAQEITKVGGIMNGTCNYILDSMTRLDLGYAEALSQAQALGYAEADPSADVDGIDTWNKTVISSNVGFGISLEGASVPTAGIRHISAADIANFKAHGLVCKLIGRGISENGLFRAHVQPTLFPQGALEAAVPANFNLITLEGSASGRQSLYGQGAGRYPTAYNVLQDCVDLTLGRGYYAPYGGKVSAVNDHQMRYYVADPANLPADWAAENWNGAAITKAVPVAEMHAWLKENPSVFIAAIEE